MLHFGKYRNQALKEVIDACQKERALLKKQLDGKEI